jgi:hypothetical protein
MPRASKRSLLTITTLYIRPSIGSRRELAALHTNPLAHADARVTVERLNRNACIAHRRRSLLIYTWFTWFTLSRDSARHVTLAIYIQQLPHNLTISQSHYRQQGQSARSKLWSNHILNAGTHALAHDRMRADSAFSTELRSGMARAAQQGGRACTSSPRR